ncbi:MAG: hypothetical protein JNM81_17345 [Rhodospirillaceae bacterium]|nr:hypothetical protein [Rhodospirillaceae bacterium]
MIPAIILLIAGLGAYAAVAFNAVMNGRLDFEEIGSLIKGWWYITGTLQPFGNGDTATMLPAYPYALGALQKFAGLSITNVRFAMVGLGIINGILLFYLCRKLTANTLAAAAAAFIYLGSPATSYSFSTATPIAFAGFVFLLGVWLLMLSLGRHKPLFTVLMGVVLATLTFTASSMWIAVVLLALVHIAAVGRARLLHAVLLIVVTAGLIGGAVYTLPEPFTTYLLQQPPAVMVLKLLGQPYTALPVLADMSLERLAQDAIDAVLFPYSGTILMCVLMFGLTLSGPHILWVIPYYLAFTLIGIVVLRAPGCETCAATTSSQVISLGGLATAVALAFLSRWRRQQSGAGSPLVVTTATIALALNCFAPALAMQDSMRFFPVEMFKQPRPAAEMQDVNALMRVIGEHVPGNELVLLLHRVPGLPYAVHMAGRRFEPVSINPMTELRSVPATLTGQQREATLASLERSGHWSGETLRRWIERDYDMIILQDNLLVLDDATTAALGSFDAVAVADFRGVKLTIYKRKT